MIKAEDVSINYESAQFDSAAADLYQDEEGEIPAESTTRSIPAKEFRVPEEYRFGLARARETDQARAQASDFHDIHNGPVKGS